MQRTESVPACEREAVWTDVTKIRRLNMIRPPLQSPLENIACCQIMRELAYFHKVCHLHIVNLFNHHPPDIYTGDTVFFLWNEFDVTKKNSFKFF